MLIHREIGDRKGEGIELWKMSLALHQLGERAQAIKHAEQALSIFGQIENPDAYKVPAQIAAWLSDELNPKVENTAADTDADVVP